MRRVVYVALTLMLAGACRQSDPGEIPAGQTMFTRLPASYTGVDFINQLEYTEEFNAYTYRNFYNGGGVAIGDINNDNLPDLYFCGNMRPNKLYLNLGELRFEDITDRAGVACPGVWSSGVSMADINGDGWLDIYVCKSGSPEGENRNNELFLNNGDGTFSERSEEYGLADLGLSSHAVFFDYDRDGDLDCYLLNNSIRPVGGYDIRPGQREVRDTLGGNKLYRNELINPQGQPRERFTDVSAEAGIYGSSIGFGLGVTVGDLNRDGWLDIYVSNDFFERDYLYLNNHDGTFSEVLEQQMREISLSSMGADLADINNDGWPDIFVTDMLPEGDARYKTKTSFENWDKYALNVRNGYFHQYTRNVLQLNNGDGTFSEIGRLANVFATDWSWGALMQDFDNDGWKDIFVANGIYKDLTDQDYINFYSDPNTVRAILSRKNAVIETMIDAIPSEPVPNYAFHNNGDLTFTDLAEAWGLGEPGFSNGSAYGDLDNDGDLELVVNNVGMPAFIYRNEAAQQHPERHFLQLRLEGNGLNRFAFGAQVTALADGRRFYQEQLPMKGFQSSVDQRLHLGLGEVSRLDSLIVAWPNGSYTLLTDLATDQILELRQSEGRPENPLPAPPARASIFTEKTEDVDLPYRHRENDFVDFDRERLLYHMVSAEGPCLCAGDLNGDGRPDLYLGGAKGQPGSLLLQDATGNFVPAQQELWETDRTSEDVDCRFFDADGDGRPDLYVVSGGNEFSRSSDALFDRLYLNRGQGRLERSKAHFPAGRFESTSCVEAADFDGDGDLDLFVGGRLRPFLYGVPVSGYLLENDGRGSFADRTADLAPGLIDLGLLTDARWRDCDGDGDPDLVVVGEWMSMQYFRNEGGKLVQASEEAGLAGTNGFWNAVEMADLDSDGDLDLILGNHGLNSRFKASPEKPVSLYVGDFDSNGMAEQIITVYNGDQDYPLALRHDLVSQLPGLKKKYLKYENYREQTIEDVFTSEQLAGALHLKASQMQSMIGLNDGQGHFELRPLPQAAQLFPVYAILADDFDGDGTMDILLGGNFYRAKPEVGKYDAGYGLLLLGDGKGGFTAVPARESGFRVVGEIRSLQSIPYRGRKLVVVARNNDTALIFEY